MRQIKQIASGLSNLSMSKQLGICAFLMFGFSQMTFAQSTINYKGKIVDAQANLSLVLLLKKKVPIMAWLQTWMVTLPLRRSLAQLSWLAMPA